MEGWKGVNNIKSMYSKATHASKQQSLFLSLLSFLVLGFERFPDFVWSPYSLYSCGCFNHESHFPLCSLSLLLSFVSRLSDCLVLSLEQVLKYCVVNYHNHYQKRLVDFKDDKTRNRYLLVTDTAGVQVVILFTISLFRYCWLHNLVRHEVVQVWG